MPSLAPAADDGDVAGGVTEGAAGDDAAPAGTTGGGTSGRALRIGETGGGAVLGGGIGAFTAARGGSEGGDIRFARRLTITNATTSTLAITEAPA